jgi:hypothetical protein
MAGKVRRIEAPWTIEETASSFKVWSANGFMVSHIYWGYEPKIRNQGYLKREEARRLAVAVSRLPELLSMEKALKAAEPGADDDLERSA